MVSSAWIRTHNEDMEWNDPVSCHCLYLHALINDAVHMFRWWGCTRRADWRRQSACVCGDWTGAWQHSDVHCSDFTHNNYMETKIVQSVKYVQIYSLMLFDLMLGFLITGSVCYQTVWTCLLQSRNGNVMVRQQWLRKYWFKISAVWYFYNWKVLLE